GSAAASAWRAPRAAACAGVACFGMAASPQKPRALITSAGVCGFASAFSADAGDVCLNFADWTICASAAASCNVATAVGLARGIGTGSTDLAAAAAAITATGVDFSLAAGAAAPSSSSSLDLPLNKAANRFGRLLIEALSPL